MMLPRTRGNRAPAEILIRARALISRRERARVGKAVSCTCGIHASSTPRTDTTIDRAQNAVDSPSSIRDRGRGARAATQ